MKFAFRTFAELGEVIARMTPKEKQNPVCLGIDEDELITLGTLSFAEVVND